MGIQRPKSRKRELMTRNYKNSFLPYLSVLSRGPFRLVVGSSSDELRGELGTPRVFSEASYFKKFPKRVICVKGDLIFLLLGRLITSPCRGYQLRWVAEELFIPGILEYSPIANVQQLPCFRARILLLVQRFGEFSLSHCRLTTLPETAIRFFRLNNQGRGHRSLFCIVVEFLRPHLSVLVSSLQFFWKLSPNDPTQIRLTFF